MDKQLDDISFHAEQKGEIQIFYLQGELIYQTVNQAKQILNSLLESTKGYILNLEQVKKIDSTGFGFILNMIKKIPQDSKLVIVVSDPFIKDLFNITKIDKLVELVPSISEAMDKVKK